MTQDLKSQTTSTQYLTAGSKKYNLKREASKPDIETCNLVYSINRDYYLKYNISGRDSI